MRKNPIKSMNRVVENVSALLLMVMVILIFLQIVSRVIFASSFSWTEELSRYLMVWITFLGASFAFQYGAHIGVEFLVQKLPQLFQKFFEVLVGLICLSFFILMIVKGIEIADKMMIQKSPALKIPMGYVYLIMPISGLLMSLNLIDVTYRRLFKQKEI